MKISKSLLLQQQYLDSWEEFKLSKESKNYPTWDYIVITASNDFQSQGYLQQIDSRKNFLPSRSKFLVVPDEGGKRVGSGGATLTVLQKIYELEKTFHHLRILVIHSGGDSKRTPQYSALGKLFSPVPRVLPDGRSSTLFDEIIIAMSGVAPRIKEGMLLLSGDALLLFNPLKINFALNEAGCITFKEKAEVGQRHGVFVSGDTGFVKKCLQKKNVEILKKEGAIDENGYVDIDTGAIIFSSPILESLYQLINTKDKYIKVVNSKVRLSLYIDFMYPFGEESTLENFLKEKPEGDMCDELIEVRKEVWELLRKYKLKQIKMYPAKFIHFGSTPEIMNLMNNDIKDYEEINWSNVVNSCSDNTSCYNSLINSTAKIDNNVYVEISYIHDNVKIGKNVLLSFVEIDENIIIPDDVILHGLKQNNGKIVCRILGINDNPKEEKLFGKDITSLPFALKGNLWNAILYPECDTMKEAVISALNIYKIAHNQDGDLELWKKYNKKSLSSGFNDADSYSLIEWNKKMINLVKCGKIEKLIEKNMNIKNIENIFDKNETLDQNQKKWLEEKLKNSNFEKRIRLLYYFGETLHNEEYIIKLFDEIKNIIINEPLNNIKYNDTCKIIKDKYEIYLPLRVNFAGGWTDTPPYCLENGGKVLNATILLKGIKPIHILIEKINEKKIKFLAKDINEFGEFENIEQIQKMQKDQENESLFLIQTCLIISGIIPKEGGNLEKILERIGSGFSIQWEVISTPRGSGLGTASILISGILKSIYEFFEIKYNDNDIINKVMEIEQIMGTGGGWQDTIGGISKGFKLINSEKGIYQNLNIKNINIKKEHLEEFQKRFLLINTGERRLSRTLLKQVIERYIGNIEENIKNLSESKFIAEKMAESLESGNIDDFAKLLNEQWNCSLKIIPETTNNLINGIFKLIDEYIDGKMICGPGGGGFLQVILKKGINPNLIKEKLKEMFGDSEVCIYECNFE
jgi:fucokinase